MIYRAALVPLLLMMFGSGATQPPVMGVAAAGDAATSPACAISAADRAWLDQAMVAWNFASSDITGIGRVERITAIVFDSACAVRSATAMNGGPMTWVAARHNGQVTLPSGATIPANVISFAASERNGSDNFFVMSTPSIWRAAGKSDNGLGSLEILMTAVVIHEATHVAQMPTYGRRIASLATANRLPETFNDDTIQERFAPNAEFRASVRREIDLLLGAAEAGDDREAARLAREARASMRARHARWFTGTDAYLVEAEDVFLTLEGSGQWAAYQWVVHPRGGNVPRQAAFHSFGRLDRWWSQDEGFALFMALDRVAGDAWKRHAFGDGERTVLQMLDDALARSGSG